MSADATGVTVAGSIVKPIGGPDTQSLASAGVADVARFNGHGLI